MINESDILEALRHVEDPDLKKDLVSLGMIRDIEITGNNVSFKVVLTTPACPLKDFIENACRNSISHFIPQSENIKIEMSSEVRSVRDKQEILPGVKNIIAVASGKGGVGKSTVAAGLAMALNHAGARTGIMDADIYGPSIPLLFGVENEPVESIQMEGKEWMKPVEAGGIKLFSIGFLSKPSEAIVWRGPMVSQAIKQFMNGVYWGELDYLIVDLPPGTGDVQLTLVQNLPLSGALIVCTPQKLAVSDASRACSMFRMPSVNVKILGIVENMSYFQAEDTGKKHFIFGNGNTQKLADEFGSEVLGTIPVREEMADSGLESTFFGNENLRIFSEIAGRLVRKLAGAVLLESGK